MSELQDFFKRYRPRNKAPSEKKRKTKKAIVNMDEIIDVDAEVTIPTNTNTIEEDSFDDDPLWQPTGLERELLMCYNASPPRTRKRRAATGTYCEEQTNQIRNLGEEQEQRKFKESELLKLRVSTSFSPSQ